MSDLICEVCSTRKAIGVVALPCIPMSSAICIECLSEGAIPYWAAVANTACCGGWEHVGPEWKEIVEKTLQHLGKTLEQFLADVKDDIRELDAYNESQEP